MNINFEAIEKAWFKPKKNVLDELEEFLINEKQIMLGDIGIYVQREIDVILDKIQELKKEVR